MKKVECSMSLILPSRIGNSHMLLEQVYLLFIYILFFELIILTVAVVALLIAFIVIIRKLGKKYISAWPLEMYTF